MTTIAESLLSISVRVSIQGQAYVLFHALVRSAQHQSPRTEVVVYRAAGRPCRGLVFRRIILLSLAYASAMQSRQREDYCNELRVAQYLF